MKHINIKNITNLHNVALRGLDFYGQEIKILQERLEEITAGNTDDEVLKEVDHFQDQLIIHQKYIDELRFRFELNSKNIESEVISMAGFIDENILDENEKLYDQYINEEKIFNDLRHEFNRFAAEWM